MTVPPNIRVANDFFHDSLDFLHRYQITVEHFFAIKSKRLKLFLDLRMAAECILKAYSAYFYMRELSRDKVIQKVEKHSHKIGEMAAIVRPCVEPSIWERFNQFVESLNCLPVGLRYQLDGADFRQVNEDFYYETVGSDAWLDALHDAIKLLADTLGKQLQTHSRVVTVNEIMSELMAPQHNKYAKR
jgi:hypothetical protein